MGRMGPPNVDYGRVAKSPAELLTGEPHAHWLELLRMDRLAESFEQPLQVPRLPTSRAGTRAWWCGARIFGGASRDGGGSLDLRSGLLDKVDQTQVDVLAPSGLVAVDGEHIAARLEDAGGIPPERYHRVTRDIAVEPGDELAIDVDLGVFIVVDQELRSMQRTRIELERPAEPDVTGLPFRVHPAPGVALVPKPLSPRDQLESLKSGAGHPASGAWIV